nr:hypothetical protein [Tanacetum cinerariifolium]
KLLKDLKELAEYDQSISTDHLILLNDNEDHPVQNRESPENSFEEIVVSNPDQEKKPEATTDTELSSTKDIHPLAFLCVHDDIDNLIESALDSKLLSINSINPQRLDKKEQEVKNVEEQQADHKINSDKLDPYCFNVEYDFVESLLNRDTFIDFSSKFDFSGELVHINPEIPKSDFDFEEEIRLMVSDENDDDYDLLLEEVDLFLSDNSIPPGIENIADDLEGDIRFLEELLINDSILSHESFNSSFEDSPSIS